MNRLNEARAKELLECHQILDEAGIPEFVMLESNCGVPCNTVSGRLRWFLARRKSVTRSEAKIGGCSMEDMLRELDRSKSVVN